MKIYRNKLYSIPDAAKRGGVTEEQITVMLDKKIIDPAPIYFKPRFINGRDIPGLKGKWKEYQKVVKIKKAKLSKKKVKNDH